MSNTKRPHWTRAEDNKLRNLMAGYTWPAIARIMGRTIKACQCRADGLQLKHATIPEGKGGWFTVEDLCEVLGADKSWVMGKIWAGKLPAHEIGGQPRVSGFDLRAYIKGNPRDVSGRPLDMVCIIDLFFNRSADT